MSLLIALALGIAGPADPSQALAPVAAQQMLATAEGEAKRFDDAFQLIDQGKPADAIPLLDEVIGSFESRYSRSRKQIFCARSAGEVVLYAGMGAAAKKDTEVLDDVWCNSYFFKGYALIDLERSDEAKPWFDKAIAMAPMNSHFLGERAEWYKSRKDWPQAYSEFEAAANAADFSPDDMKTFDRTRGWRGMAFVRIEQGKLDEAEALLRKCLQLNPEDSKAKSELDYVASLRPHSS